MDIDKLEIDKFTQRTKGMYRRLADLYENLNTMPIMADVLPQALIELGSASEIVNVATEELHQQNEELIQTRNLLEAERQRYQDLFEFAPDGYLVTNTIGMIREANRTAAKLLNLQPQYLVGKPIVNFIALQDRQTFRSFLIQIPEYNKVTELVVRIQKRDGELFDAAFTVGVIRNQQDKPIGLRWLLRDITERKQVELGLLKNDGDLTLDRPWHKYCKGELIPLNPGVIWYVCKGCVKLSTLCETGEEVMVGLAGVGMVFGSTLTALHIYQATALSDVELVSIHLAEIAAAPTLSHTLLPKINQRLRQTESFLAIAGRRRVQDRFHQLLMVLTQEIGEPVPQGTRLLVRLTHEELASACSTTRVTITRLIGKLQQQGKIGFDSKHHIVVRDEQLENIPKPLSPIANSKSNF
ncbi:PAS domain S-box protein [Mastigocladopsis repens]|uniref:PAS domain S-box protein n=1 Tax=Mastigocladopsis repens TaxID=221287 RepID=UPI000313BF1A|nr:PAS domain S-box protein [Mastigocladopsis repens]